MPRQISEYILDYKYARILNMQQLHRVLNMPQYGYVLIGTVLGPLLFLLYINNRNQAIKFCNIHHFADDTNLLYLGKSIKKLSHKLDNFDLKNLLDQCKQNFN